MMEPIRWQPVPKRELPEKVWAAGGRSGRTRNNFITTLRMDAQDCEDYNLAIQAKYNTIQEQEIRWEERNTEDCEILLVAYGTPARIAMTAVEQLRAQGIAAGLFRPITLWPFPAEPLGRLAAREGVRAVLSVEMSLGQLVEDVRLAVEGRKPVHLLGRSGGQTPTVAQIVTAAREALKGGK
jgi:2-oxoglutarate ferredoxin oxidoreductase subunit alpha